ncbi:MAG: ExbD/TolR family protein [Verrucomicrobiia bacterium]
MNVQTESKPYDDINITPMLDLSYVLLIIFIIMCTASVQGVKVNLPSLGKKPSIALPSTKAITITNDGHIMLDTFPVSFEQLDQSLRQLKSKVPEFPVVIRGDSQVPYQVVMDILELLKSLNITKVGLATQKVR